MSETFVIGLDFGSESARGTLIEASTGRQAAYHVHAYRHGIMTEALPGGRRLPAGFALQAAADYLEAAEIILTAIGAGRNVAGIGVDFTASSPMPALADGRAMSEVTPDDPHAYVKLWKHAAAQSYAEAINAGAGSYLANFGGKVSGEWLLAKAAQIAAEALDVWRRCDKFIEAGDWLVWRLTGREARSLDFAAYKAQYESSVGYPDGIAPGLSTKLSKPVGSAAGQLTNEWRERTGIQGRPSSPSQSSILMSFCRRSAPTAPAFWSVRSALRPPIFFWTIRIGQCLWRSRAGLMGPLCQKLGSPRSAMCWRGS
jgi:L-ribulokinase